MLDSLTMSSLVKSDPIQDWSIIDGCIFISLPISGLKCHMSFSVDIMRKRLPASFLGASISEKDFFDTLLSQVFIFMVLVHRRVLMVISTSAIWESPRTALSDLLMISNPVNASDALCRAGIIMETAAIIENIFFMFNSFMFIVQCHAAGWNRRSRKKSNLTSSQDAHGDPAQWISSGRCSSHFPLLPQGTLSIQA